MRSLLSYVGFVEKKTGLWKVSPLPTVKKLVSDKVKNPKEFYSRANGYYLETFFFFFCLLLLGGRQGYSTAIYWVETKNDAKYCAMHRTTPKKKELSNPKC